MLKEILTQSVFRSVLRDGAFGELLVGGHKPEEGQQVGREKRDEAGRPVPAEGVSSRTPCRTPARGSWMPVPGLARLRDLRHRLHRPSGGRRTRLGVASRQTGPAGLGGRGRALRRLRRPLPEPPQQPRSPAARRADPAPRHPHRVAPRRRLPSTRRARPKSWGNPRDGRKAQLLGERRSPAARWGRSAPPARERQTRRNRPPHPRGRTAALGAGPLQGSRRADPPPARPSPASEPAARAVLAGGSRRTFRRGRTRAGGLLAAQCLARPGVWR